MKMFDTMNFDNAKRMTALAIALVFCVGMFAPMTSVAAPSAATVTEAKMPVDEAMAMPQTDPPTIMAAPEPEVPDTIIIQPNATAGKDATIWTSFPSANYGTLATIPVGNGTIERRSLVEFQMPLTAGALKSATLSLYSSEIMNGPCNITVNAISAPWDEGTLSGGNGAVNWTHRTATQPWVKLGGDFHATPFSYQTVPVPNAWYSWDVTELVNNWLDGTWVNNGFILVSDNPDPLTNNFARFYSSDYTTDPSLHPKLIISYGAEITDPVPPQMFQEDGPARSIPLSGRGAGSITHESGIGTGSNSIPFWGSATDQLHVQYLYNSSQVGAEGRIMAISFNRATLTDTGRFDNFRIRMAHSGLTQLTDTFDNNYNGFLVEVFPAQTVFVNSSNQDKWVTFNLNGNFTYDSNHNLVIDISWSGDSGSDIAMARELVTGRRLFDVTGVSSTGTVATPLPVIRFLVDAVDNAVFDNIDPLENSYFAPFAPWYLDVHMQFLYNQTMINQGGLMDKIAIQHWDSTSDWLLMQNCTIRLAHAAVDSLTMTYEDNRDGPWVTVMNDATVNLTGTGIGSWMVIDIDNLFTYDNTRNLLIDLSFQSATGTGIVQPTNNVTIGYNGRLFGDIGSATGSDLAQVVYGFQAIFADPPHLTWSATSSDPSMFTASVIPGTTNLTITPQPDQFGSGTVSLRLTNTANGAVATQIVPIVINAVNDAPILAQPPGITCVEDIPYIMNLAPYMSDIDDETFTLTVTTGSSYATVSGVNITFLYPEGISNETVTITIRDPGGLSDSKIIQVTVTQINDKPYFTGFPASATCDATVPKAISLSPHDEETATNDLLIYTSSQHINVTGRTLHLLYPKGVGSETVTVYLVDELIYGTRNNVSYTLEVTVIDHPEVINHAPTGNSVPIVSPVRMTFDAEMNRTRTENAFSMKFGTSPINGTFSWNAAGTEMTFTPPGYMLAGVYDVNLASSAEDMGGVKMLGAHNWNFTVVYGDYDGDGMPDEWEIQYGLDPTVNDASGDLDGDGMPNLYEFQNNLNPAVNDADEDADGDGYTNLEEYLAGTDPNDPESAPSDFTWIILLLVLVAVIAVVLIAVMLGRKKKPAPEPEYQEGDYPPPPPGQDPYYPPPEGQGEPLVEPGFDGETPMDPDSGLMPDTDPRND